MVSMTAFTSFFVRSECWSVIFWINSDFVIIFAMVSCPGFRSSTIVGIRTKKSKISPICTVLFQSCALAVRCFSPKSGWPRDPPERVGTAGPVRAWVFRADQAPESVTLSATPTLGLPALAVSTGHVGQTPVGLQIVANRYREDLCLCAGDAVEARGTPPAPIDPRNCSAGHAVAGPADFMWRSILMSLWFRRSQERVLQRDTNVGTGIRKGVLQRRWTRGSSPRVTPENG